MIFLKSFEKELMKILKENKLVAAEIKYKLDFLKMGKLSHLDTKIIARKNGVYNIEEIRVHHPQEIRIFYTLANTNIIVCGIEKKKCRKFPPSYFDMLDKRIQNELQKT